MKKNNQGAIVSGLILIFMGVVFLAAQFFPDLFIRVDFATLWPIIPLGVGICLFFGGLLGSAELLVPGTIVSGVGTILYYQNSTNNWDHWQLWLLVPVFVGVGTILSMLRAGKGVNKAFKAGTAPLIIGIVLYAIFTGLSASLLFPFIFIAIGLSILFKGRSSSS